MTKFGMEIVEEISDERNMGDGVWLYFKPGYIWQREVHQIHEDTLAKCKAQFKYVTVCTCEQCVARQIKR